MRVLVCGGRDYSDRRRVFKVLDFNRAKITMIIHGAARGADSLAAEWCELNYIVEWPFPADWARYGRAAGFRRNEQMLEEGKPDLVVAFPGGIGTQMMVRLARDAGVRVIEVP